MIIKIILIGGSLVFGVLILKERTPGQYLAFRRLGGVAVVGAGVVAVLFPDLVTWVANLVGVGRGTDLVLYLFVMLFLFVSAAVYQRMHTLEKQITNLARELALRQHEDHR